MPKTEAPETVEFNMQYDATCPECASAGNQDVPLGFSIDHGGIVCKAGEHHFDALPGAETASVAGSEAPDALPQPEVASGLPQVNQGAGAVSLTGFSIKTQGGAGRVDPNRAQQIKSRMAEVLQEQMRDRARKPVQAEKLVAAKIPGGVYRKGQEVHLGRELQVLPESVSPERLDAIQKAQRPVQVSDCRPVAGGEMEFTLRLREGHLQAVRAEAEVQRQPLEVYLQEWLERVLNAEWGM